MTSIRHRFLIDECLPPKLVSAYLDSHVKLSDDGVEVVHIKDFLGVGKKDTDWVPEIARDKRWCVLSADKGSHSSRREALPLICFQHKVTLISVSHSVVAQGILFYGPQLLVNWPSLVKAMNGPKGAQYLLRKHATKSSIAYLQTVKPPRGYAIEGGELIKKSSDK